jgi:hypothetical protein
MLRDNEAERLWERIPGCIAAAESFALEKSPVSPGLVECWRERLDDIRKELRGDNPSESERLLAQYAALCWLRLSETEMRYTQQLSANITLTLGMYYEKRLTLAQRRFTKAVETLERVRLMRRRTQIAREAEAQMRRA